MKQSEILGLIGLSSTDPKLLAFFDKHELKAPKTINSNASWGKDIKYKEYKIDFIFNFDIINEAYYPPISPKKNDFYFIAYLSGVRFYKATKNEFKPNDFWDVTPNPLSPYQDFENYYGKSTEGYFGDIFTKSYNDLVEFSAEYEVKKKKCTLIYAGIKNEWELISYVWFKEINEHNNAPQAYTFLIKWLFDNRFLNIDEEIYKQGLDANHATILEFVQTILKNKLWHNQLIDNPVLVAFIGTIDNNNGVKKNENGEQVIFFIQHLFLIATGNWEQYQKLYKENIYTAQAFIKSLNFTAETAQEYLKILNKRFEEFIKIKDLEINK